MKKLKLPSQEYLRKRVSYNPDTGIFFSINKNGKLRMLRCHPKEYFQITIDHEKYYAHRIAWKIVTGNDPLKEIDHINLDKSDNRFCNLREASRNENERNKGIQKNNNSGYKGVYFNKATWAFRIKVNGVYRHICGFKTPQDAYEARKEYAPLVHGEFSRN